MRAITFSTGVRPHFTFGLYLHYSPYHAKMDWPTKIAKGSHVDTLLFTGGHGNFQGSKILNELSEKEITSLCEHLQHNPTRLKSVIMDSCDSAYFITHFKPLMANKGVIYCNLSDGRQHNIVEILNRYDTFKPFTIGIALHNIISLMINADLENGAPKLSYPSVYLKENNTLYYYGHADIAIINHLQQQGIVIQEIQDKSKYLNILLKSETPLADGCDKLKDPSVLNTWLNISHNSTEKLNKLPDATIIKKLISHFEKFFPDKNQMRSQDYVAILFPLAQRYAKKGTNPIYLLAQAACQYRLENIFEENITIFYEAIAQELQLKYVLSVLRKHLDKMLHPGAAITQEDFNTIENQLTALAKTMMGHICNDKVPSIVKTVLSEHSIIKISQSKIIYQRVNTILQKLRRFSVPMVVGCGVGLTLSAFAWSSLCVIIASLMSGVLCGLLRGLINHIKHYSLIYYRSQGLSDSNLNSDSLHAFMNGTDLSYTQRLNSCLIFRDWQNLSDYYAGRAAKEAGDEKLISQVKKRLKN